MVRAHSLPRTCGYPQLYSGCNTPGHCLRRGSFSFFLGLLPRRALGGCYSGLALFKGDQDAFFGARRISTAFPVRVLGCRLRELQRHKPLCLWLLLLPWLWHDLLAIAETAYSSRLDMLRRVHCLARDV